MEVEIPYAPRDAFKRFHGSGKRWSVLCCHRRAGKTVAAVNHLIRDALTHKKGIYAYIGPTYAQSKRVAWQYLKDFSLPVPGVLFNESELRVDYPNGSRVYVLGSENPNSLRGLSLDGVVFDEYSQQPPNIFGEIIAPSLADKRGYAIWLGTIIGKNQLWRLWEARRDDPEWFCMYLRASESNILLAEELAVQRSVMSNEEYLQEFELEPTASIRGAYYSEQISKARQDKRVTSVPYDKNAVVSTYWDLGIGDATAIIFVQSIGREWHVFDYLEDNGKPLDYYARLLAEKKYIYASHNLPHDARARELGTGKSREETLQNLLIGNIIVHDAQAKEDGIHAARMIFDTCWFDEKQCERLIEALSLYRKEWDDKTGVFKTRPLHDWTSHGADAFRYFAQTAQPPRAGRSVKTSNFGFSPVLGG